MRSCYFLVFLIAFAAAANDVCQVGPNDYKNGQEWETLPSKQFIMKCIVDPSGEWTVKFVGCKTKSGKRMNVGETVKEENTEYKCEVHTNGNPRLTINHDQEQN